MLTSCNESWLLSGPAVLGTTIEYIGYMPDAAVHRAHVFPVCFVSCVLTFLWRTAVEAWRVEAGKDGLPSLSSPALVHTSI
jgi:hypothetical protein